MDKTTLALAALALTTLSLIGFTVKDHPAISQHLDRFCPALCSY